MTNQLACAVVYEWAARGSRIASWLIDRQSPNITLFTAEYAKMVAMVHYYS